MMSVEFVPSAPKKPVTNVERIGNEHERMTEYVRNELGRKDHKRGPMEELNPRHFTPADYAKIAYKPDMYVIEPAVLDALEEAKAQKDTDKGARLEKIRHHWRAMSWWSHGPTNPEVAGKLASDFLQEAHPQTGFDYADQANHDVAEWTRVLNTLKKIDCKGDTVAEPTDFVEKKISEAWKDLIKEFKNKKNKSEWPTTHDVIDAPKLSENVEKLSTRLTNLRNVHDQLLYQLLFPKHCMYAQDSLTSKKASLTAY